MPRTTSNRSVEPAVTPRPSEKPDVDRPQPDDAVFYALCPCGLEFMAADDAVPAKRAESAIHMRDCPTARAFRQGGHVHLQGSASS